MIFDSKKTKALKAIERNIEKHGFHIYIVEQHSTPRFAYTIGLSKTVGVELLLAGAIVFDGEQVLAILHAVRDDLTRRRGTQSAISPDQTSVHVPHLRVRRSRKPGRGSYYHPRRFGGAPLRGWGPTESGPALQRRERKSL